MKNLLKISNGVKKRLLPLFLSVFLFGTFSFTKAVTFVITSPLRTTSFLEMVDRIGSWVFTIAIGVLPIMILVGAFMLVTASGDPKKVATGRKLIFFSVIGFIIVMSTRGIIALFRLIFGF